MVWHAPVHTAKNVPFIYFEENGFAIHDALRFELRNRVLTFPVKLARTAKYGKNGAISLTSFRLLE